MSEYAERDRLVASDFLDWMLDKDLSIVQFENDGGSWVPIAYDEMVDLFLKERRAQ